MINKDIFKLAGQLQNVVNQQMKEAHKALEDVPDSEVKEKLKNSRRFGINRNDHFIWFLEELKSVTRSPSLKNSSTK